jgi:two-component system, OmpR family, osmolarity sensor histidine kinase EnvZ
LVKRLLDDAVDLAGIGLGVAIDCDPALSFHLRRAGCLRALANLLTNAARHGAPPIRISAAQKNGMLLLTVTDAGRGFGDDELDRMLKPFRRGDSARGGAGTGLGLSIAAQVAQAHEGALITQAHGHGFSVQLTLRAI